ncbi:hypothetical protein N7454_003884 [Penicillium verhagenii]|nr:hypothetical protein N7454_003884 [Penicillium verhagenii]
MAPSKATLMNAERMSSEREESDSRQRWLFVTGFPVIAGTLCVMAMMFNICALSSGWQQPVMIDDKRYSLPGWTVALQAISLAIAVSVYIAYLLLMQLHDKPVTVFWINVLGWLMAATILFSVVGVAVQRHHSLPLHTRGEYTQAFYYGVFSAGLYAFVAFLMALYVLGALHIQLSRRNRRQVQRMNVLLRALWLAIVLLVGAAIYRAVEGWSLLDALYFADFTILTIGIGKPAPATHLGRSLLFPYATTGIIALALMVSAVISFTHDMRDMKLRLQMAQMRDRWRENAPYDGQDLPLPRGAQVRELHHIKAKFHSSIHRRELVFFLLAWLVLWFISAAVFRVSEKQQGWSYFVALYFTYTSLTTIGYGDFYPTSSLGKVFLYSGRCWLCLSSPTLSLPWVSSSIKLWFSAPPLFGNTALQSPMRCTRITLHPAEEKANVTVDQIHWMSH